MKINKKIVVSSLSTTMALSFVAALSGTVAWYQFNTRVSTTLIGTNVANSGVLQISQDETNWGRDLVTTDLVGHEIELTPVTFGAMNLDGSLPADAYKNGHADAVWDKAEGARDAFDPSGYNSYEDAVANTDYIQYTVYLRARESSSAGEVQVAKDVYLTDVTFDNVGSGKIASALRAHLAIDTDGDTIEDKFLLVSKDGVEDLALNGVLDFDDDGVADRKGGAEWVANRDKVTFYGNDGDVQNALAASDLKASRDGNGNIDAEINFDKKLFTTLVDKNVKVTVTLWIEGWDNSIAEFKKDGVEVPEILYRKVNIKPVSTVDSLYTQSGSNYLKASGNAVNGTNYFELTETEVELEEFEAIPDHTYTKSGDNYMLANGVAVEGGNYYKLHVKDANEDVITPAELDAQLSGLYEKVNNQYVLTDDDNETFDAMKVYYSRINETVNYDVADPNAAPFVDGNSNILPSNNVNVSKYYVKDSDNNYVKVSKFNVKGETYYSVKPTLYNPLLNTYDDGTFSVAGLFVANPAFPNPGEPQYIAAAGTNLQATSYFLDDAGTPAVSFSDLPDGAFASIDALELYAVNSGVYAPQTGANVNGVTYYTVEETDNPELKVFENDLFSVEEFYVANPAHELDPLDPGYEEEAFILATGNNVQNTDYYLDENGANKAHLNDLFELSGEKDLSAFGLFVKDSEDAFVPVGNGNVLGKDYYSFANGGTVDNVPMWTGLNTDQAQFHFGLTFDVGHDAFKK